jgi:hypothetical protein
MWKADLIRGKFLLVNVMGNVDRPFEVVISNVDELRMGSPYNTCNIHVTGIELDLPQTGWQDKYVWSANSRYLVLVRWNLQQNNPGFNFIIIDSIYLKIQRSEKIPGLLEVIEVANQVIKYRKFLYDRDKSKGGNLCCYHDDEYLIDIT